MKVFENYFERFCSELDLGDGVKKGSWFGMPCLKVGGSIFAVCIQGDMAVKLPEAARVQALHIPGAKQFDPRGRGRPTQDWVLLPEGARAEWCSYARQACRHVANTVEEQKTTLIAGMAEARQAILQAASQLSFAQREQVFLGEWGIKDLVAHLIGWDYTNLQAIQSVLQGERPEFWQYFNRDWATYNAMLVERYRQEDWTALLESAKCSHQELTGFLESLPPGEFVRCPKIGTLLRAETKDEKVHARQVREFALENNAA